MEHFRKASPDYEFLTNYGEKNQNGVGTTRFATNKPLRRCQQFVYADVRDRLELFCHMNFVSKKYGVID